MGHKTVTITHDGITLPMSWWAKRVGVNVCVISRRLAKGLPIEDILSRPVVCHDMPHGPNRLSFNGRSLTVKEWAVELGVPAATIHSRLESGLPPERVFTKGALKVAETMVAYRGREITLTEACAISSLKRDTILARIRKGVTGDRILQREKIENDHSRKKVEINGEWHTLNAWSIKTGVPQSTLSYRYSVGIRGAALLAPPETTRKAAECCEAWVRTIDLPWEADLFAQHKVRENPDGMDPADVAELLGCTRQRVVQIEQEAFAKLRKKPGALHALQQAIELSRSRKFRVEPEAYSEAA
jgi:DNA-binding XRE family transcriptional regulator